MKYISLLFITLFMVSCGNSKNTTAMKKQADLTGNYKITMVGTNTSFSEDISIDFNQKEKTVSGNSGCNVFNGSYTSKGAKLEFDALATTRKMCHPDANTLEQNFLKALQNTKSYAFSNGEILFYDDAHFTILKLQQADMTSSKITNEQSSYKAEYSAISRGYFMMITFDNNNILYQKNKDAKAETKVLTTAEIASINKKIAALDLKSLETLTPPSTAHQYDGAAIAGLTITQNGTKYTTPSFDGGNPPKAIEALISEIMSYTEN